jgi:hypothetical protein
LFLRLGVLALVLMGNLWGVKNVYQSDTPPLDRVAAVIAANMMPGDGIVLSEAASGRWGLTYYLGPPYGALPGLEIENSNGDGLIHSLSQMKNLRRVWLVVVDGETSAIDPEALRHTMKPTLTQRVGAFQITRFE